jgi:glycosyltransferase involved in cell wall biosynthesis
LRQIPQQSAEVVVLNEVAASVVRTTSDSPVSVIPNFTDPAPEAERPRSGWVYVGRLAPEKGALELVRSWPEGEPLDIYGDGPLMAPVAKAAKDRSRIRLMGLVEHDELLAELGGYEGLILPSLWPEGLPTVVLEALARGVPIISSDQVAATPLLVGAGAAEPLPTPATTAGLGAAIAAVRGAPRMAEAASALHAQRYSRTAWLDAIAVVYDRVTAKSS